jgi:hypothetical protein
LFKKDMFFINLSLYLLIGNTYIDLYFTQFC